MKKIETSIIINAPISKVWEILTDFENYGEWNPLLQKVEGLVRKGQRIKISLPSMAFKPLVLDFQNNSRLEWQGSLFVRGLFDGKHSFVLIDKGNHVTEFRHCEVFTGILVFFLSGEIQKTAKLFEQMNMALKDRVEAK